jgi:hypothetical protein
MNQKFMKGGGSGLFKILYINLPGGTEESHEKYP